METEVRPVGTLVEEVVTEADGRKVRRRSKIIGHIPGAEGRQAEVMLVLSEDVLPRDRPGPTVLK